MGRITRRKGILLVASLTSTFSYTASAFTTIPLTATLDVFSGLASNLYSVPFTGDYLIFSKLRLADNSPVINYSQGVHTSNVDGSWVVWTNTVTGASPSNRNGLVNVRASRFNQGDSLRLYMYSDNNATVGAAEINVVAV